ncbi:glutamate--cysteine ligase [Taxawa tesnikishii (nom. ined.)]|nr:glutamate--cysteine ligase [Dothideales sp. JES 119]
MDSGNRQSYSLPPINHLSQLDVDKIKQEADYQHRNTDITPVGMATSAVTSPTYQYPSGPPPPYSQPAPSGIPQSHTPPGSRRTSGEDKEQTKQQPKQSLPSIHEALGVEQPAPYTSQPTCPPPMQTLFHPAAPPSPSPSSRRSREATPPRDPTETRPPYSASETQRHPQLHPLHTPRSPVQPPSRTAPQPYSHAEPSPIHERPPPPSGSMVPPSFPYGYAPYPPQYTYPPPPPPPSNLSGAVYQPSVSQQAPAAQPPLWKTEKPFSNSTPGIPVSGAPYGESVKRHLDMFDFEAALNEVAENSAVMLDFSRQYGARLHQTQRSGPLPGTLPAVQEIDDIMAKTRHTLDSLTRMREVLIAQQAAYFQQVQEQRFKAEDEHKRHESSAQDDGKIGGFAGAESKNAEDALHLLEDVIAATERRLPNGAEGQMAPVLCAMLVVFITLS